MAKIKGITIELGADTSALMTKFRDVTKESRNIQKSLNDVNRQLKFDPKNVELLSQKTEFLKQKIDAGNESLKTLNQIQNELDAKGVSKTSDEYMAVQREIEETTRITNAFQKQLNEIKPGVNLDKLQKKFSDVGKQMQDVGKQMSLKVTTPLVGLGTVASVTGIQFEKAMSGVQAVTGATGDELKALEASAREAGATTNKSASEAAAALEYMGLAGWSVKDSQEALLPILKLSSAANMDLGATSDMVTDVMSVLGLEINELDGFLDILAETSRNSNTNVAQLGEAMLVVGGKAKQLNINADDLSVALGIMADNGIKGSEAGRGLNAIITNLTSPVGRAKEALDALNISAFDSSGEFIGLEATLQLVESATSGMTQEQQTMYASMIAGKEHSKTLSALMGGLGGSFDSLTGKVASADGALEDMYKTSTDNTQGAIEELRSAVEELSLKIFDSLKPVIDDAIAFIQKLTDKFNAMSPEMQETVVRIGLIAAAIGPLLFIGGKLFSGIGGLIGIGGKLIANWGSIASTAATVAGGVTKTIGFLFSPAGMILVGIAAAIAIGVALYKNWDTIKEKASQLASYVGEKFNNIREGIMTPINKAKDGVFNAIEKIKSFFKFEWSLPPLKLPRISMTGKFSLLPPSVPKFGIEWRKDGAIFKKPTIFDTRLGLQGVGDARSPEVVAPLHKLKDMLGIEDRQQAVTQNITINSPEPLSPSETARQFKNASRELAMGV